MFYRVIKPLGFASWFYNPIKYSRSFIKQYVKPCKIEKSKSPKLCHNKGLGKLFSKALIASSLFFPTKIGSTVPKCQILYIRLVVRTARISTLEKQNVDCMTEKLNILKRSRVPVMHLLSQTTSRQLVTT